MSDLRAAQRHERHRFAWARLNAYGLLIAGLVLLSAAGILQPDKTGIARVIGRAPAYQYVWLSGYAVAGILMLWGLVRAKTGPEILGLALVVVSLTSQTVVLIADTHPADWWNPILVWVIAVGCIALRMSALLSRDGMSVIIPGRRS